MSTKYIVKKYIDFCNKNIIQVQTHQIYGVLWCIRKENETKIHDIRGGILADDMGMGKTIQMIATIFLNFRKKTLILLPPILIQQWYSEIFKILGHSSTIYYKQNRHNININTIVVITSYDTFLRSPELLEINWDRTICDEAHRLRNPKTKLYKQILQLRTNILWCITGTPIHNKMKDVMSLFALFSNGTGKKISEDEYKTMILRRTKTTTNILLPKKTENQKIVSWTNREEWKLAKDVHMSMIGNGNGEDSFWNTKNINDLVTMIRAKQLCILPKLLEKTIQRLELDEPDDLFPTEFRNITRQHTSCKLKAIIQYVLARVNNGRGKIIFCHFQLEMTKIAELLREEISNSNSDKKEDIWIGNWKEYFKYKEKDKDKTKILIMQIRSGSEGLNLQKDFSEIYFVSPNWNPTLEEQAIARCHRIGQQKEVFVFRFYMDNLLSESEILEETQSKQNIITYVRIINKLPNDIYRYIHDFLVNDIYMPKNTVYSIDMYTLFKQNEKRKQISEFLNKITI